MNLLSNSRVYLLGPVENVPDAGTGWRDEISRQLRNIIPSIQIYDPLVKPSWVSNDIKKDPAAFSKAVYNHEAVGANLDNLNYIRTLCQRMINTCDWAIAYLPKQFTVGSFEELTILRQRGTPVLFCCPDGVSGWLMSMWAYYGCQGNTFNPIPPFTHDFDHLLEIIAGVNKGRFIENHKLTWYWIYAPSTS